MKPFHFAALAAALGCLSCASSSSAPSNTPPEVQVTGPDTVAAANGQYNIPFTVTWKDADNDAIANLRYRVPAVGTDTTQAVPAGAALGVQLTILVSATAPKQAYDFTISVFDARGAESKPVVKQVTLQ